jgi:sarcosine oxidase
MGRRTAGEGVPAAGLALLTPKGATADPCLTSETPDRHFVLGISEHAPAVLAGGLSSHVFNHATACGDIAVDLAIEGTSETSTQAFSPDRFGAGAVVD